MGNCLLQTLESDLAVRVASLLQQRVALSMENNKLKQQLATVRKEKLIVDGKLPVELSWIFSSLE